MITSVGPPELDPDWDEVRYRFENEAMHHDLDGNAISLRHSVYLMEWRGRILKQTKIGDYLVSTVFLPINHAWQGGLLIYETMVFDQASERPYGDLACERYATYQGALRGHARYVNEVGLIADLSS